MSMDRFSTSFPVSVTTSLATTGKIPYGAAAQGEIEIPAGSSITSLTWNSCTEENGTYAAVYDDNLAAPVAQVQAGLVAGRSYPIPTPCAGKRWLKPVGNAAGAIQATVKG